MGTNNRRINKKDLPLNRPQNRTEDLIMYCKLLKYMRNQPGVLAHGFYKAVCENKFWPFIKTSPYPWDRRWYYAFWYSEAYGWLIVSLDHLNDVKL